MGATPKTNRSAKDGARSIPHYGGEGVSHSPIAPRCLLAARYGRFTCDPRRPACVPAASRVSDHISESEMGNEAHAASRSRTGFGSGGKDSRTTRRHAQPGKDWDCARGPWVRVSWIQDQTW